MAWRASLVGGLGDGEPEAAHVVARHEQIDDHPAGLHKIKREGSRRRTSAAQAQAQADHTKPSFHFSHSR